MKTGDKVLARDKNSGWVRAIYLFTTKYDRHICQRPYDWEHGHISWEIWDEVKPAPRTETRVKKASEIMLWLEENDFKLDEDDDWAKGTIYFVTSMWKYCGKEPYEGFDWLPEWLEEVEV